MGRVAAADRPSSEACARKAPVCDGLGRGLVRGAADATCVPGFSGRRHETFFRTPEDPLCKKGGRLVAAKRGPQDARCLGPGAGKWPRFFGTGPENSALQATAVWTWTNFLHDQVPEGLTALRVNFDKTGIVTSRGHAGVT